LVRKHGLRNPNEGQGGGPDNLGRGGTQGSGNSPTVQPPGGETVKDGVGSGGVRRARLKGRAAGRFRWRATNTTPKPTGGARGVEGKRSGGGSERPANGGGTVGFTGANGAAERGRPGGDGDGAGSRGPLWWGAEKKPGGKTPRCLPGGGAPATGGFGGSGGGTGL